ncbi:MAG: ribulose-phosphate 3-epimerase [Clostridiales bacterium]|jgi:ribulose-phosphate 3-epimerase|nr:ribulose-phosphate 3-epimerase [Clostridiales bacterium]
MIKLSVSLLSADFTHLADAVQAVESAGAHYIHVDVMDGHFAPNITFGPPVVEALRKITSLTFDIHLMVENPGKFIEPFARAGADIINIHAEASENLRADIESVKKLNKIPAVTIKPNTDVERLFGLADRIGMALIMSVEPGFAGQTLKLETLKKVEKLASFAAREGIDIDIEIDGGARLENVKDIINAGANVIVAGSAIFGRKDIGQAVREFYDMFKRRRA